MNHINNITQANTLNSSGGEAYLMTNEKALAQLAYTGTSNGTFHASGESQVAEIIDLANKVSPAFLARVCVYSRQSAFMKDTSATLLAVLCSRDINLFKEVFNQVVDNGKMLKNFCKVIRSGTTGRKSFGSAPKKMIEQWLKGRSDKQLLEDSVGNDPSLVDVIKMVHPHPVDSERDAFYAYLLGKGNLSMEKLPKNVQEYEQFKQLPKGTRVVPNVPFQLLTSLDLSTEEWVEVAKNAGWQMTRMNLNTFARHGVFESPGMTELIAERLSNRESVLRSKVFPYQLFAAYHHSDDTIPVAVKNALQDAMEVATENIPRFKGKVVVGVDCSGSMNCPVTGNRGKVVSSKVTCNQVAALVAACVLRNSEDTDVIRFDTVATKISLNPRDSVMTNCERIGFNGGGTDCSAPVRLLNKAKSKVDLVIIVSDNESWYQIESYGRTSLLEAWTTLKANNPKAKLVCIDLAATSTTQVPSTRDCLNIGGWSDNAFTAIAGFLEPPTTSL